MSMWSWFKTSEPVQQEQKAREEEMIEEPVKTFLQSLKQDRKRYKLQRVLKLSNGKYPDFTCYHWMKGAGFWELTDTKTGNTFAAYVHEEGRVYEVYSLPFRLNHWELKALWDAFNGNHREKAKVRKGRIRDSRWKREREAALAREAQLKKEFVEQFK